MGTEAVEHQQSSLKPKANRNRLWTLGGLIVLVALTAASFLIYSFARQKSSSPLLKIKAKDVSVPAGESLKFNITLANQSNKQIKIESLAFIHPNVEQRFSLSETSPQATGEELVEKAGTMPRSMNFEYAPPITVNGGKTERVLVEGEAYTPGLYTLRISAHTRTEGFDLMSYFGKRPDASTQCTIVIYPESGAI